MTSHNYGGEKENASSEDKQLSLIRKYFLIGDEISRKKGEIRSDTEKVFLGFMIWELFFYEEDLASINLQLCTHQ